MSVFFAFKDHPVSSRLGSAETRRATPPFLLFAQVGGEKSLCPFVALSQECEAILFFSEGISQLRQLAHPKGQDGHHQVEHPCKVGAEQGVPQNDEQIDPLKGLHSGLPLPANGGVQQQQKTHPAQSYNGRYLIHPMERE